MSETDALYSSLRERYEQGMLDDPLLCRAFADAQPNQEQAAALEALQGRLSASEEQRRATEQNWAKDREVCLSAMEAMRAEHSREIHARDVLISELKRKPKSKPKPKVSYEPGEKQQLEELGWSKSAGD